jgi:hypothetical protein
VWGAEGEEVDRDSRGQRKQRMGGGLDEKVMLFARVTDCS